MLVVTTNDIPGWEIQRVCGGVIGLTVRPTGATGLKNMFGANPERLHKNLFYTRQEAMGRLIEEARSRGGNAVVAMRFDTTELCDGLTEICAYGTAVQAVPATEAAKSSAQQLGYGPQYSASTL